MKLTELICEYIDTNGLINHQAGQNMHNHRAPITEL